MHPLRRVLRWAWNGLTVLSLLLFVAACVLWARSYAAADFISWYDPDGGAAWRLSSTRGQFRLLQTYWIGDDPPGTGEDGSPPPTRYGREAYPSGDDPPGNFLWFRWSWDDGEDGVRQVSVAGATWRSESGSRQAPHLYSPLLVEVPHWLIVAFTALAPARALGRVLRRRRSARLGLCPSCSYDLTGNESGVCPECGTVPA